MGLFVNDINTMYHNWPIKRIEEILEKNGADLFNCSLTNCLIFIRQIRQQKKSHQLFREALQNNDINNLDKLERLSWNVQYYQEMCVEEVCDLNLALYINIKKLAIADCDEVYEEYIELKRVYDEYIEARQVEADHAREDKLWNYKDAIEKKHGAVKEGFVYVLSNMSMPETVKVGFTARTPVERAKEMSARSGLPTPFEVERFWRVRDPFVVEGVVHAALSKCAIGREFFSLTPAQAINHISGVVAPYCVDSP